MYCYDLYIPNAPAPKNKEQIDADSFIMSAFFNEKNVEVLEKDDYCCYHGYKNFLDGDTNIHVMQKPVKIIPVTLIAVYEGKYFQTLLDVLVTADKLRRIVPLLFDTTFTLPYLQQCGFSVEVNSPQLLP